MGFGHRGEARFDGVMRLAFCLDGDHERHGGAEVRRCGSPASGWSSGFTGLTGPLPGTETRARELARELTGADHDLTPAEYASLAEGGDRSVPGPRC